MHTASTACLTAYREINAFCCNSPLAAFVFFCTVIRLFCNIYVTGYERVGVTTYECVYTLTREYAHVTTRERTHTLTHERRHAPTHERTHM